MTVLDYKGLSGENDKYWKLSSTTTAVKQHTKQKIKNIHFLFMKLIIILTLISWQFKLII